MSDLRTAAQQALEALEWISDCHVGDDDDAGECASCHERSYKPHAPDCKKNNAITALRAALVAAAKDAEHQQTLALQQRSYEREIQLEVEAEREACAKVCEDYDDDRGTGETWGPRFAALIRARDNPPENPSW